MTTQLVKWGNSQGIRIPKGMMEEAGIQLNEALNIAVIDGKIVIERISRHYTLEERAAAYGGTLGPYEEFDWGEPVGKEVW